MEDQTSSSSTLRSDTPTNAVTTTGESTSMTLATDMTSSAGNDVPPHTVNTARQGVPANSTTGVTWSNLSNTTNLFTFNGFSSNRPCYTSASTAFGYGNQIPFSVIPSMASTNMAYPHVTPTQSSFIRPPVTTGSADLPSDPTAQPSDITLSQSQISSRQVINKDLPSFSGHPEDWPLFITNYEQSTERCGFSNQENLIRLQRCLKGAALEAVRGKLMMPSTVPLAIETLRMLFGRPDVIHDALQRKLRQLPPVRTEKLNTLINFALAVQNYTATMVAIGLGDYLNDPMLLNDLLNKLPGDMKLDFGRRRLELVRVDIGTFDDWLFKIATCASLVTPTDINFLSQTEEKASRKNPKERIFLHDSTPTVTKNNPCTLCSDPNQLYDSPSFIAMSQQNRWKFIKERGLCIRCLKNHLIKRCHSKRQCGVDGCNMAHNSLLHSYANNSNNNRGDGGTTDASNRNVVNSQRAVNSCESTDSNISVTAGESNNNNQNNTVLLHSTMRNVLFKCIPVTLYGNDVMVNTLALVDEGSSISLIEENLANELRLDGPSSELCMKWTGDITMAEESRAVNIGISSQINTSKKYKMFNVRTISNMDLPEQALDSSIIRDHLHLKSLPIQLYSARKPRILIGLDNINLIAPLEVRENSGDGIIATRCRIGWSVYGRDCLENTKIPRALHICDCNDTNKIDEIMRYFFSLESVGVNPNIKTLISKDEEKALEIMESTTKYIQSEKRWETGLLWRYKNIQLPNSLPMARRRLECLERKMSRDNNLKMFVNNKITDYLEKGYIRKLPKEYPIDNERSWYLPIFVVNNVNKNKLRVVWDAASKVNNISLNSVLLKGPDMMQSLIGILIRFRERATALCGDIREMFHQVLIREEDQVAQLFLWRGGDASREPDTYIMRVMTFGASCSPSLANYVKNKNADRFFPDYPQAV
ncbi:uncharacterized protein LOC142230988 [Haematobia irritans]|uniref:uncharacterized protein LOC142230988 n=1 Tax=Haematobia irritans TaxID=7368 RepID=UPI003F50698D